MEHVTFKPFDEVRDDAERAFQEHRSALSLLLPFADIQHIGGTALPGVRTKGDLDIQVRVPADRFVEADAILAQHFDRNVGSTHTATLASFKNDSLPVPLGVQLTAIGGAEDFFVRARDRLRSSPELAAAYDQLKARFEGQSMDEYRAAKAAFFERLLAAR